MARKDIWEKKRSPWIYVGYAVVLVILGYVAYSVYYYLSTAEKVEEYEVCAAGRCIKTFHVHADISIQLCGKKIKLPLEHGPLEGPHTHKERNYIHFHERLPYDQATKKLLDTTPLQLGVFMNEFDIRFNDRCIADYCNGDPCPEGKPGTIRMFVSDQPNSEFDQYVWHDEDKISITFD